MTLRQILDRLRSDPRASRIAAWRELPARPARWAPFPDDLDPHLSRSLARRGISQLYTHQAESYDAVRGGANIVVVTPTASGKTLCYNLPVLDRILPRDEQASARRDGHAGVSEPS